MQTTYLTKDLYLEYIKNAYNTIEKKPNMIKKWAKDAGIDKYVTFHTSRHTFATMLLTKDVDIYTVSKLLGHRNVSTTQIYADLVGQKKVRAINSLNGVLD